MRKSTIWIALVTAVCTAGFVPADSHAQVSFTDVSTSCGVRYSGFTGASWDVLFGDVTNDGKDDLMLEIFTGIIDELESLPDKHGDSYFEQEGYLLFDHVSENKSLYRSILDSHTFSRQLREHVRGLVQQHLDHHTDQIPSPTIPLDVAAQHMVSSLLGIIDWWLSHDQPYSIEQMALIYERLIIQATWHALESEGAGPGTGS